MSFEIPCSYRLPRGQEISVQQATPESVVAVIGLFRVAYRDAYAGSRATRNGKPYTIQPKDAEELYRPHDRAMVKAWREAFAQQTTADGRHNLLRLTARSKTNALLGYAAIKYSRTPNTAPCAAEHKGHILTAELREIDVAREARRKGNEASSQGVGTALMHASASFLSTMHDPDKTLGLTVAPDNVVARQWYERLGFTPSGHETTARWPGDKGIHLPLIEMTTTLGDLNNAMEQRYPWLDGQPT